MLDWKTGEPKKDGTYICQTLYSEGRGFAKYDYAILTFEFDNGWDVTDADIVTKWAEFNRPEEELSYE